MFKKVDDKKFTDLRKMCIRYGMQQSRAIIEYHPQTEFSAILKEFAGKK